MKPLLECFVLPSCPLCLNFTTKFTKEAQSLQRIIKFSFRIIYFVGKSVNVGRRILSGALGDTFYFYKVK